MALEVGAGAVGHGQKGEVDLAGAVLGDVERASGGAEGMAAEDAVVGECASVLVKGIEMECAVGEDGLGAALDELASAASEGVARDAGEEGEVGEGRAVGQEGLQKGAVGGREMDGEVDDAFGGAAGWKGGGWAGFSPRGWLLAGRWAIL